jgi:tetratricopeptide repeat protein
LHTPRFSNRKKIAQLSMKIAELNHSKTIRISIAVALVFLSPGFICAEPDNTSSGEVTILQAPSRPEPPKSGPNTPLVDSGSNQLQPIRNDSVEQKPAQENIQPTENRAAPVYPVFVAVTKSTPAKRAVAMRLIATSQSLLRAGEYDKAVSNLEKALSLEASPYVYFYLARAHYGLGHYQDALNFLEVAESWLDQQPDWAPQLAALKAGIPGSGLTQQSVNGQIEFAVGQASFR